MVGRIVTNVLIRGTKYQLLDIPGKEHDLGKMNNQSATLWVKKDKSLFNEEDEYIPWIDIGTNRASWNITINQGNSISYKHNDWVIKGHTTVNIRFNNSEVYEFSTNNLDTAFSEAQNKIRQLSELPVELDNLDIKGRKIYYKGMPAIIHNRFVEGSLILSPDCDEKNIDGWWDGLVEPWFEDYNYDHLDACQEAGEIKVDILSPHIYWFRDDRTSKLRNNS